MIDLAHAPRVGRHDDDPVREHDRLGDRMGDEEDRLAVGLPEREQPGALLLAVELIQGRERLVHEQDAGVEDEGTRNGDALLHPARELRRIALERVAQPEGAQDLLGIAQRPVPVGPSVELDRQLDVGEHATPGQERRRLGHEADQLVARRRVHALAIDLDAALVRVEQSRHDLQQGGLPAAARSDDRDELAARDGQVHVVENHRAPPAGAEGLRHSLDEHATLA